MIKKAWLPLLLGLLLGACSANKKQAELPTVEERPVSAADAPATPDGAAQTFAVDDADAAILRQLEDPDNPVSIRIIYFDYDSSAVLPRFSETIKAHAELLQANPALRTTLEGHADERGSREYNLALGERRALTVKQRLVVLGVSPEQVRVVSYGEERPADSGHDQQAWGLNRRVEFTY